LKLTTLSLTKLLVELNGMMISPPKK